MKGVGIPAAETERLVASVLRFDEAGLKATSAFRGQYFLPSSSPNVQSELKFPRGFPEANQVLGPLRLSP